MRSVIWKLVILVVIIWGLAACGNSESSSGPASASLSKGEAEAGKTVFNENGCVACHSIEAEAPPGIGPSLAGVADRGLETLQKPDYTGSAETVEGYLWESITDPQVYVAEGYSPTMPVIYSQSIEEQDIANLVAYLLTLN